MASFRKRGNLWQAQVRRNGFPPISKSFSSRRDAELWAFEQEVSIQRDGLPSAVNALLTATTLRDLVLRYQDTVTPSKRSADVEKYRLNTILKHKIAKLPLKAVTPAALASFRDERLKTVKGGTVRKDLSVLSHLFDTGNYPPPFLGCGFCGSFTPGCRGLSGRGLRH
jgi:hypothetical protein